jgi:hypothetical protein
MIFYGELFNQQTVCGITERTKVPEEYVGTVHAVPEPM